MEFTSPRLSRPIRLAVLISGGGTTLTNFAQRIADGRLSAEISLVIASRSDCGGIARGKAGGCPCHVIERKQSVSTAECSGAIFDRCCQPDDDLVVLAGFLALVRIPDDFENRVLNIHPALIPSFCGKGFHGNVVHQAVVDRGVKVTGCTVHFADNQYDHGPIILQRTVPVAAADTPQDVAARVFEQECEAYPEAVRLYAEGRLRIDSGRVYVDTAE